MRVVFLMTMNRAPNKRSNPTVRQQHDDVAKSIIVQLNLYNIHYAMNHCYYYITIHLVHYNNNNMAKVEIEKK